MFLNVSMSMRSFWWIQLYLNLSFHNASFGTRRVTQWGEHVYFLTSQGAQNYEAHNVLLNLLLGARKSYQLIINFEHVIAGWVG